jgi:hypothetical protein
VCNNYCFSTTATVGRTGLSVTLYVQYIAVCLIFTVTGNKMAGKISRPRWCKWPRVMTYHINFIRDFNGGKIREVRWRRSVIYSCFAALFGRGASTPTSLSWPVWFTWTFHHSFNRVSAYTSKQAWIWYNSQDKTRDITSFLKVRIVRVNYTDWANTAKRRYGNKEVISTKTCYDRNLCIFIVTSYCMFMYLFYVYVFIYVYVSSSCQLALFDHPDWGFSRAFSSVVR